MSNPFSADDADAAFAAMTSRPTAMGARAGYAAALDTNPDAFAEAKRVAASTGVPVDTALELPKETGRQAAVGAIDFDTLAKTSPATAGVLADYDKARVAHDNVDSMRSIEDLLNPVARMLRAAGTGATADFGAATYGALETFSKTGADALDPLFRLFLPENPLDRLGLAFEELRKGSEATANEIGRAHV